MGQYYNPISCNTFEWIYSHDFGSGLKLMEHSWVGNEFVGRVMKLLTKGNKWYKTKLVWAGDYSTEVYKDMNLNTLCSRDEEGYETEVALFKNIIPKEFLSQEEQEKAILVNHSKKEYVIISKGEKDEDDWIINPLPLLTALGNGSGGGDYWGRNNDLIGSWAFDEISVEFDLKGFEDFEEIIPNFFEGGERYSELENQENEKKAEIKIREWLKTKEVERMLLIGELR